MHTNTAVDAINKERYFKVSARCFACQELAVTVTVVSPGRSQAGGQVYRACIRSVKGNNVLEDQVHRDCRRLQSGCPDSPGEAGKTFSEVRRRASWPQPSRKDRQKTCKFKIVEVLLIGNYISN